MSSQLLLSRGPGSKADENGRIAKRPHVTSHFGFRGGGPPCGRLGGAVGIYRHSGRVEQEITASAGECRFCGESATLAWCSFSMQVAKFSLAKGIDLHC